MLYASVLCVLIAEQIILQLKKAQNFREKRFHKQSVSTGETVFSILFGGSIRKKESSYFFMTQNYIE